MSNRRSQASSKHEQRVALFARIELRGADPDMPCTFCHRKKLRCRMSDDSGRCSECVRRGRSSCDGVFVASTRLCPFSFSRISFPFAYFVVVTRLLETQRKLEAEEEKAEEALQEALSRLARVRQIKRRARQREDELFKRGMQELDEADGVTSSDPVVERQQAVGDVQFLGGFGVIDWDQIGLDLSTPVLADPGSSDGTGQAVQGNS